MSSGGSTLGSKTSTITNSVIDTLILNNNNLKSLDVSMLDTIYLNSTNNSSLTKICVSQQQYDSQTTTWSKDGSTTYSVGCDMVTSTNYGKSSNNILFPNPTTTSITFSDNLTQLVDIHGHVMFTNTGGQSSMDIASWSSGLYFAMYLDRSIQKLINHYNQVLYIVGLCRIKLTLFLIENKKAFQHNR